jgi:hypothetical protein
VGQDLTGAGELRNQGKYLVFNSNGIYILSDGQRLECGIAFRQSDFFGVIVNVLFSRLERWET